MTTWTAAQQREAARSAYNAELADCPGHQVLAILSGKWATLVVEALVDGPRRHAELAARVAGATQKMLTQTLRALERDGLVDRTVIAGVPVRGGLPADRAGRGVFALQRQVRDWADRHAGAIAAARGEHDRARGRVSES
jgi:DNA-binding HxlR family transcriptional regulator